MASENQIKHKIVISGEQEYKRAMREMSTGLKEAKSEVKATAAEMDAQGRSLETLSAHMKALEGQRQREVDMLREMQRHLEAVVSATGAESEEASRLRTRINAMRTEIAQTSSQMSRLTSEMNQARTSAEGLGSSAAADGIMGLGDAAQSAEGDMDGILGKLGSLGQGIVIGIGAQVAQTAMDAVTKAFSDAVVTGWNQAVNERIEYNSLGVKTGTAGSALNDFMMGILAKLKLDNPNRSASEWIDAIAAAYTDLDESTFNNADRLNNVLTRLDAVSIGTGIALPGLVTTLGRLKRVFNEDEDELTDILYWLGTSPTGSEGVSNLEKYATTWKKIGMNAMGAAGALVLARVAGVYNLDAVGKAANDAAAFILTDKEGLEQLGLMAADLPNKFRAGGEEAKEAMRLLLESFLNAEPETQEELGPKIFGQKNWELYGTKIAEALLGGYETELTSGMREATDNARAALTHDIESEINRLEELKKQALGATFKDAEEVLLAGLASGNEAGRAALEGGKIGLDVLGAWIGGFWSAAEPVIQENAQNQMEQRYGENWMDVLMNPLAHLFDTGGAEEKGEETGEFVTNAYLDGLSAGAAKRNSTAPVGIEPAGQATEVDDFLDRLMGTPEEAAEAAEEKGAEAGEKAMEAYIEGLSAGAAKRNSTAPVGIEPAGQATEVDDFLDRLLGTSGADAVPPEAEEAAEEAGEVAGAFVTNAYLDGLSAGAAKRNSTAPAVTDAFLSQLLGTDGTDAASPEMEEAAKEAGEAAAESAIDSFTEGAAAGMDLASVTAQVKALNEQIGAALNAGDMDLADELKAKRDALLPTMMQLAADAKQTGEDAKGGFDDAFKGVTVTVEDTATGVVTEWKAGTTGLPGAAQNSVDGLMGVLNGAKSPAYTAGFNAGKAFLDGYNDAQGIRSPSRVMAEAARYSMAGLLEGLDSGVPDLMEKANGLSGILSGGARSAGGTAGALALSGGGSSISAAELRELLTNIVLTIDGDVAGGLVEKGVSTESARRAAGTIRGRANGVRSW